ncbi:hypothetical protein SEA_CHARM_38 [Mycobacterium phage Charm]|nr:hypothetical protein SEA_CHARM_38 [Mycobacterium phage Charm]
MTEAEKTKEPILTVYDDFTVDYYGEKFGLATNFRIEKPYEQYRYSEYFQHQQRFRMSFDMFELPPPPPPPKPRQRRTWRDMGLRRPTR